MRKRGAVELTLSESWGLIKTFAIILIILVVSTKIFFFVNPAYAASKSTLERFSEVIKLLEDGESRSITLDLEKGVWLFGFNKDKNFIEYRRTVLRLPPRQTLTLSKPGDCLGRACLCLCTDECKRVIDCKDFDDIKFFVVTDISQDYNGGVNYEDREGSYLAMPGKGIIQVEVSREKDVIYISGIRPEDTPARGEFERFVSFAKNNIGVRYPGTCKLVFEIDLTKLVDKYNIMIYADGNATLFFREDGLTINLATQTIEKAPILTTDFKDDEIEQIFENYDELPRRDFSIPFIIQPPDPKGLGKDVRVGKVVLLQKDGKWLWTKREPTTLYECS